MVRDSFQHVPHTPSLVDHESPLLQAFPELTALVSLPLDHPLLAHHFDGHDAQVELSWVANAHCTTLRDLLTKTPAEILAWQGIGEGKLDRILRRLAVIANDANSLGHQLVNLAAARDAQHPDEVGPSAPAFLSQTIDIGAADNLTLLAEWGDFAVHATTWGQVLESVTDTAVPEEVAHARQELLSGETGQQPADPGDFLLGWINALDQRDREILEARVVKSSPRTLQELADRHGPVSRERIRQLEVQLTRSLRELFTQDPAWRHVRWAAFLTRDALGAYAPRDSVDTRSADGTELFDRHLLLWLSDLSIREDAIVREGFTLPSYEDVPVVSDTYGAIVDMEVLGERLVAEGVRPEFVDFAVDSISGVHRIEGVVVRHGRSMVDQALAVLAVHGKPMEFESIHEAVGGSERSLRQRLYEDERFIRTSRTALGLRLWGGDEYGGIVAAMLSRLEEGGELNLADLAAEIAEAFNVSPASVTFYSAAPLFVTSGGTVRLRTASEPYAPRNEPQRVPGLYRESPDVMIWHVQVDTDLRRGSGRTVPHEIATFVGVTPGVRILLSNPVRDIPLSWPETSHVGPQIGSLKPLVDDLSADLGQVLRLKIDRTDRTISASLRPATTPGEAPSAQVAWLTGLPKTLAAKRAAVAVSLMTSTDDVEQVLRDRGDHDVADAVAALP